LGGEVSLKVNTGETGQFTSKTTWRMENHVGGFLLMRLCPGGQGSDDIKGKKSFEKRETKHISATCKWGRGGDFY